MHKVNSNWDKFPRTMEENTGYIKGETSNFKNALWYVTFAVRQYYPNRVCILRRDHPCMLTLIEERDKK